MKFNIIAQVEDDGEYVEALQIELNQEYSCSMIDLDTFSVEARNLKQDGKVFYEGNRKITDIYLSNEFGKKENKGQYLFIELEHGYQNNASVSIYYNVVMKNGIWDFFNSYNLELQLSYTLKQNKPLSFNEGILETTYKQNKVVRPLADLFSYETTKSGLAYRQYVPTIENESHPLIIWFHGSGEGGQNNLSHIIANKGAVAFVKEDVQALFKGAYVLAPQCPYNWAVTKEGLEKINLPLVDDIKESPDYVPQVMDMIHEVCLKYPNIDQKRIYLAGCSAGASMVWKVLLRDPEKFAGVIPICGPEISKEELAKVVNVPIWMVHSKDDTTVPVEGSIQNKSYLDKLNGKAKLTLYENVSLNGNNYPGHWSWIYALNNLPQDQGISLFEWLSKQERK